MTTLKKIITTIVLFTVTAIATAQITSQNNRYDHTTIAIQNNTSFPVRVSFDDAVGRWENPLARGTQRILQPNETYQNTLISTPTFENFASISVSDMSNPHENYLIFSENSNGTQQYVTADIVDGLGNLFVRSQTNACRGNTEKGYAYCLLSVKNDV